MRTRVLFACTAFIPLLACGSAPPQPATAPDIATSSAPPAAAASAAPASSAADPSLDAPYDDPEETTDPTNMTALFDKSSKPTFPKATVSESDCWRSIGLTGDAHKDYEALAAKCGAPTGSVPYTKVITGKLHSIKDKRDTYVMHLMGGLCYRFFGVADGSVKDLDILIEQQKGGALVGDDKTHQPVAIIESDKSWCMDRDVDYQFLVQVGGTGTGHYLFGVWAKPK